MADAKCSTYTIRYWVNCMNVSKPPDKAMRLEASSSYIAGFSSCYWLSHICASGAELRITDADGKGLAGCRIARFGCSVPTGLSAFEPPEWRGQCIENYERLAHPERLANHYHVLMKQGGSEALLAVDDLDFLRGLKHFFSFSSVALHPGLFVKTLWHKGTSLHVLKFFADLSIVVPLEMSEPSQELSYTIPAMMKMCKGIQGAVRLLKKCLSEPLLHMDNWKDGPRTDKPCRITYGKIGVHIREENGAAEIAMRCPAIQQMMDCITQKDKYFATRDALVPVAQYLACISLADLSAVYEGDIVSADLSYNFVICGRKLVPLKESGRLPCELSHYPINYWQSLHLGTCHHRFVDLRGATFNTCSVPFIGARYNIRRGNEEFAFNSVPSPYMDAMLSCCCSEYVCPLPTYSPSAPYEDICRLPDINHISVYGVGKYKDLVGSGEHRSPQQCRFVEVVALDHIHCYNLALIDGYYLESAIDVKDSIALLTDTTLCSFQGKVDPKFKVMQEAVAYAFARRETLMHVLSLTLPRGVLQIIWQHL